MPDDILKKIAAYLQEQKRPVLSAELAAQFLKLTNAGSSIGEQILTKLLESQPQFCRSVDGAWTLQSTKPDIQDFSFVICKIFPETAPKYRIQHVYLSTFSNGVFQETIQHRIPNKSARFLELAHRICDYIKEYPILFDGFGNQRSNFQWLMAQTLHYDSSRLVFSLAKIVKKLLPTISSPDELCHVLLGVYQTGAAEVQFENFQKQVLKTVELLLEKNITTIAALELFTRSQIVPPDYRHYAFDSDFINQLPTSPGVYIMTNKSGEVIYVGKAKNLKRRLQSYFNAVEHIDDKLAKIRDELYDIQILETGSELEALLHEYDLIQKYNPPINIQYAVQNRFGYSKERHPQIVFLPSLEKNVVKVLLFNPDYRIKIIDVAKDGSNSEIHQKDVTEVFENSILQSENESNAKIEIITSWLSRNRDRVSSIDMRTRASVHDVLRLMHKYVVNFDPHTKQIFL